MSSRSSITPFALCANTPDRPVLRASRAKARANSRVVHADICEKSLAFPRPGRSPARCAPRGCPDAWAFDQKHNHDENQMTRLDAFAQATEKSSPPVPSLSRALRAKFRATRLKCMDAV